MEVDFILGQGKVAIEVKGANRVDKNNLKGLLAFREEYSPERVIVVCNEKQKRIYKNIEITPWNDFLKQLWKGDIL